MAGSGFADELRAGAAGLWEAQHAHPFVRGIADGTLSEDRFVHYVRQDYVFLIEYARMLALGAARAPDLQTMVSLTPRRDRTRDARPRRALPTTTRPVTRPTEPAGDSIPAPLHVPWVR